MGKAASGEDSGEEGLISDAPLFQKQNKTFKRCRVYT